jgi:hypothetical protein
MFANVRVCESNVVLLLNQFSELLGMHAVALNDDITRTIRLTHTTQYHSILCRGKLFLDFMFLVRARN